MRKRSISVESAPSLRWKVNHRHLRPKGRASRPFQRNRTPPTNQAYMLSWKMVVDAAMTRKCGVLLVQKFLWSSRGLAQPYKLLHTPFLVLPYPASSASTPPRLFCAVRTRSSARQSSRGINASAISRLQHGKISPLFAPHGSARHIDKNRVLLIQLTQ